MSDNDVRFSREQSFYQKVFRSLGIEVKFSVPRHPQSNGLCERTNRAFLQNRRAMTMEMRSMDWPKLTPVVTWLMNSQISPRTGYSPMELFLGRPSWKMELLPEPDLTPSMQTFLKDHLEMQERAEQRLKTLRESIHQRRNKGRVQPQFSVGDYVLIHHSRWPQRKLKKIESPWFGPFQISEVRHNTLKVLVSPGLGGNVIVTMGQVKHWKCVVEHDEEVEENDFPPDQEMEEVEPENEEVRQVAEKVDDLPPGYFNVSKILGHKFDQGWKFLTQWEGYPVSASTWEPPKHFSLPDGRKNEVFVEYCEKNGLQKFLSKKDKVRNAQENVLRIVSENFHGTQEDTKQENVSRFSFENDTSSRECSTEKKKEFSRMCDAHVHEFTSKSTSRVFACEDKNLKEIPGPHLRNTLAPLGTTHVTPRSHLLPGSTSLAEEAAPQPPFSYFSYKL